MARTTDKGPSTGQDIAFVSRDTTASYDELVQSENAN